ncbi:MAG: hypothetical protein M0C28_18165 [Candidatus Moduliflexus flocculans]|nr:hypothetical protein [Candidatus Moduliflexus flocculans]
MDTYTEEEILDAPARRDAPAHVHHRVAPGVDGARRRSDRGARRGAHRRARPPRRPHRPRRRDARNSIEGSCWRRSWRWRSSRSQ